MDDVKSDMSEQLWADVDRYFGETLHASDAVLDAAQADSAAAGLPAISVSPMQGRLLQILARSIGARSVLEDRNARRIQHDLARARPSIARPRRDARA